MAENAKDSDERDLRGGRGCAPVRLVDQERRAELDLQGHGLSFTGIQFLGILGYAISVQGSPNLEERQSGDDVKSMLSNGLRGSQAAIIDSLSSPQRNDQLFPNRICVPHQRLDGRVRALSRFQLRQRRSVHAGPCSQI